MQMRPLLIPMLLGLATVALAGETVYAQNAPGNWMVKKLSNNILNGRDEIVEWDLTHADAKKLASELNRKTPLSAGYFYMPAKQSTDGPAPIFPDPVPLPPGIIPGITPPLPSPSPGSTPKPSAAANSVDYVGYEDLGGYGRIRFRLMPGNKAIMFDKDGQTPGTWSRTGDHYRMAFYKGKVLYTGTKSGDRIAGSASNGRNKWSFSVNARSTASPTPSPTKRTSNTSRPPYRAYMVRNGQRIRFRQHSTLGPALSQANGYRNTLGATEIGVEDANGWTVRRVR